MKPATLRRAQQGISLLEILVSMTIGLIVILGMMSVYKGSARVTAETRQGANIDGQIAIGMLMADRAMQNAGYSYSSSATTAYSNYFQAYNGSATVAVASSGNSLVWMTSANTCQALIASGNGLTLYGSPSDYSCTTPSLPTNASQTVLIKAPSVSIPNAPNAGSATITVNSGSCQPFGVASGGVIASGGAYTVTLRVTGYSNANTASSTTCLFNYHL